MELKINTTAKTITVTSEVNVGELFSELQKMLGGEFGNYKIIFDGLYIPPYIPNQQPIIVPIVYPYDNTPVVKPWWEVQPTTISYMADNFDYSNIKVTNCLN